MLRVMGHAVHTQQWYSPNNRVGKQKRTKSDTPGHGWPADERSAGIPAGRRQRRGVTMRQGMNVIRGAAGLAGLVAVGLCGLGGCTRGSPVADSRSPASLQKAVSAQKDENTVEVLFTYGSEKQECIEQVT